MDRRDFIRTTAIGMAATTAGLPGGAQAAGTGEPQATATAPATSKIPEDPDMKYRVLGRTGERVSLVGIGGFHLARPDGVSEDEAVRIVRSGLDAGINFCDNCWDYNGGESEVRLGRALQDGYRDKAFLMTKIDGRTASAAMAQLEQSLQRLKTDHLDLLQFHEVIRMDDPERIFAPGGALEAVLRAREQGKLRYIGFTGHKSPAIHRHMFEVADRHGFHFDTVQMPLNVMDAHFDSFEQTVIPIARRHDTGIIGMKAFGDPFILQSGVADPMELLHYPMSLPISVQVTGIDSMEILHQALRAVQTFRPLTDAQRTALLARTAKAAQGGSAEKYKTSHHFDGTVQNPQWLG
jgi:uncharacterized protein